jgi:uncharacterized membrane protein
MLIKHLPVRQSKGTPMSDSVSSQVAALTAILTRMERQSEEDRKTLAEDRHNADLSRSAISAELADIRHNQMDVQRRLDRIEPVTDLVTSVRSRVAGGFILLGVLGGIAWAGILFFKEVIVGWFQ